MKYKDYDGYVQRDIRSELYQGLQDCLHGGENNAGLQLLWTKNILYFTLEVLSKQIHRGGGESTHK